LVGGDGGGDGGLGKVSPLSIYLACPFIESFLDGNSGILFSLLPPYSPPIIGCSVFLKIVASESWGVLILGYAVRDLMMH
jgi:hypothetical protein